MRVPRLLVLTLLTSLCVAAAAAAQSAPQATGASLNLFQFRLTPDSEDSSAPEAAETQPPDTEARVTPVTGPHTPNIVTMERDDVTCLTIRAYRVAREHPDSDAVRPAGYSTCQPSSRFQIKTAVDSYQIPSR